MERSPVPRVSKAIRTIGHLLSGPHLLHEPRWFDDDPLARPVESVTDWPGEPTREFNQGELIHLLYDDVITQDYLESRTV